MSTDKKLPPVVVAIAMVAATGGLLFGFDTGVISGALLFIRKQFHLGPEAQETVVSAVLVGCILGAAIGGRLADAWGRKRTIILTAVVFALGTLAASLAETTAMLVAGRTVLGLGIGVASFAVPLYISEISPAEVRGALVSLNQLMITIGIVASYLVDELFAGADQGWRYMFLAGIFPALVLGGGMLFLPNSPRWLLSKGRRKEAEAVLARIGAAAPDEQREKIEEDLPEGAGDRTSFADLFAPRVRPVVMVGVLLMFFQQATGINTVIYYAPTIFQMAGFQSAKAAIWATVVVGVVNVAMTLVSIRLLDRVGRKPLLSWGLAGMTLGLFVLGAAFGLQDSLGPALRWVAVGSLLVYIASFAVSLGPIAWLLISEIYPLKIRGRAMSVATLSNWVFNFLIALTFLSVVQWMGRTGAFWLYASLGAAGWVFCRLFVPETKGVALEEIEANLEAGKPVGKIGA